MDPYATILSLITELSDDELDDLVEVIEAERSLRRDMPKPEDEVH